MRFARSARSALAAPAAVAAVALVLACPPLRADPVPQADVRVARSTTKVLASTPRDGLPTSAEISAIRNEYVAFQVVVAAPADAALTQVDATLSDLAGPGDAVVPAAQAQVYREYYHHVDNPSWCDVAMNTDCASHPEYERTVGDYPDALIPLRDPYDDPARPVGADFDVPAGGFATLFVDVYVPKDVAPGAYAGVLAVTAGGQRLADVPVSLTVWDVTLSDERHVATAYGLGGNLWRYHGGPDGGDAQARDRIRRNYEWELHRHRIDPTDLNPGLTFSFDADGALLPVDFSAYDAYLGPRIDGSYYPDGAGVNRFNTGMFGMGFGTGSWTDAQWGTAGKALAEHLRDKGWLSHAYIYSFDEPWMPQYLGQADGPIQRIQQDVQRMRQYTDLWTGHVLVTGPWWPSLDDYVDIWCPDTAMYDDTCWPKGTWADAQHYRDLQATGHELWFYVCNANFPPLLGYDLDSPYGQEPRLAQWGSWQAGATGFLYWSITYWQDPHPWQVLENLDGFGPQFARNGDGVLIYPGNHDGTDGPDAGSPAGVDLDGPVVSFRLKQIRDGMEDWELFLAAQSLGANDFTQAQVRRAVRALGHPLDETFDDADRPWDLDDAVVADARSMVARKVQYLLHPDLYPDPEPPPIPDATDEADDAATAAEAAEAVEPMPDAAGAETVAEIAPDATAPDAGTDPGADVAAEIGFDAAPDASPADPGGDTGRRSKSSGCAAAPGAGGGPAGAAIVLVLALAAFGAGRSRRHARP